MKRYAFLLGLAALFCCPAMSFSTERVTVTKDTAGTMSHVTKWITDGGPVSGQTIVSVDGTTGISGYFNYLYVGSLEGPSGSGVSQLSTGTSGYVAVYSSSVGAGPQKYLSGATIDPESDISAGVNTTRTVTGKTYYCDLTNSESISGLTAYGGSIGNYGSTSEVTATVPTAVKGMGMLFMLTQGQASGKTMFVKFPAADTVIGLSGAFNAGASVVQLSGATLCYYINIEAWQNNRWYVTGASGIQYRNGQ